MVARRVRKDLFSGSGLYLGDSEGIREDKFTFDWMLEVNENHSLISI